MCTVSMIMDHQGDYWRRKYFGEQWPPAPIVNPNIQINFPPLPTAEEIDEFRRLLDRAREYDRRNNEPDCELDEKRKLLLDMAKKLGVNIDFVAAP